MKKLTILLLSIAFPLFATAQQYSGLWKFSTNTPPGKPMLVPDEYRNVIIDENTLAAYLSDVGPDENAPHEIDLPQPDGTFRSFYIWETPVMEQPLYSKYPQIRTYTASAIDNHLVTAKIDRTPFGFHAMIIDGKNTFFIDPFNKSADGNYISYYRRNYHNNTNKRVVCGVIDESGFNNTTHTFLTDNGTPPIRYRINGSIRRTYRLALACTGEYAVAVAGASPTKGAVLAKMITSINRVNSVYERDVAVTMQLVGNNDTLIFLDGNTDPYSNTVAGSMLTQNQSVIDARVGTDNYDIGHVFGTGGGGSGAGLGIAAQGACLLQTKAWGVTGIPNPTGDAFDIDYVAHEMGHQYGASHTFNNSTSGDCSGNAFASTAYEPGGGSTIMGYAGICGLEDIQPHTSPYFHSASLEQITIYIASASCGIISATPNVSAVLPPFTASYNIPYYTPFELTAPQVVDNTVDTLSYCWEERDLGDFGRTINQTRLRGPLFRSFQPTSDRTRIFPSIDSLLKSVFFSKQEKMPDTSRTLCFRLTVRDIYKGYGCFNFPDDSIHLNVIYTGSLFRVTTPNATVNWQGGTSQTVTWNVANTDQSPINCSNVDIFLSTDGGYTFPTLLAGNTPNDGSETITLPNGNMSNMRIKVKSVGNVFFAISHVVASTIVEKHPIPTPGVNIFPVPATTTMGISFVQRGESADARIVNMVGQIVWRGKINDHQTIDVSKWAKGIYYVKLSNGETIDISSPILIQ